MHHLQRCDIGRATLWCLLLSSQAELQVSEVQYGIHTRHNALVKESVQLRILCPKSPNKCAVSASIHIIYFSAISRFGMRSIWGDLVFTAVAISIVKSRDTYRLVRHATATLCRGNTVGFVRRIAQIETGRPDIAIYHAHTSAIFSSNS